MFARVLVANRGEIAVRICRTLDDLGVASVAVYADADRDSLHVDTAGEAFSLGDGRAAETYLDIDRILAIIERTGAEAVHPGYGFLSENADFAAALEDRGIVFIGPTPEQIRQFGLKHEARRLAERAGVRLLPGSPPVEDVGAALSWAESIGYPVMLKSSAGGGGIGMQRCDDAAGLRMRFNAVRRLAGANFGNAEVFVERYVRGARHVEVQAFGDGAGEVIVIGDRDCSLQRRNQKVVEECPAPDLPDELRSGMHDQARSLLTEVRYRNAATVEFLYDVERGDVSFLEVNTRLQVEHGVTELVHGIDLVRWMVEVAAGDMAPLSEVAGRVETSGHAVEVRVYAEDPRRGFQPSPGRVAVAHFPEGPGVRVDTWLRSGTEVTPFYDPMLAKIMAHGPSRQEALSRLAGALDETVLHGIETNLDYLRQALVLPEFVAGQPATDSLGRLGYRPRTVTVVDPGAHTTLQSFPGREGFWSVGVPPSGPMDDLSFRFGNALLGNETHAAGLEITLRGPTLEFHREAVVVLAGQAELTVDNVAQACWTPVNIKPGAVLAVGAVTRGARAYLLTAGGFDVPEILGSKATFTLGGFGGLDGRGLRAGDSLHLAKGEAETAASGAGRPGRPLPRHLQPALSSRTALRVTLGPHSTDEFFASGAMEAFFTAHWTVHYNSNRTGVRLVGPRPGWARADGGEAGLHPSNIHDNAYAFGTVDLTGDMPVILGPDGPSLGGFVCPATVIRADRWKLGQLVAEDIVHFYPVTEATARRLAIEQEETLSRAAPDARSGHWLPVRDVFATARRLAIRSRNVGRVMQHPVIDRQDDITMRRSGQEFLLVEFGPLVLDLRHRLRAGALERAIAGERIAGVLELTAGIRSLQVRFDPQHWSCATLAERLKPLLEGIDASIDRPVPSRIVHLPLSWDDPACREAAARYQRSVRPDAPWCPDNIEFIRRINGLDDSASVKDIVFDASYLVMGLGDVYLGAPVATPVDPRHRLVTTKYNPARTWTAENSVGIGGSYLCIYGLEGPGGYQLFGRTLQVWNQYRRGAAFDLYWLLRLFDQIRFHEVDAAELLEMREAFARGALEPRIENSTFDYGEYGAFLSANQEAIEGFRRRREQAFDDELESWRTRGLLTFESAAPAPEAPPEPAGTPFVASPVAGSVWSVEVAPGQVVAEGDLLFVLESMKSEFEVVAPAAGTVSGVLATKGQIVRVGQPLAVTA